MATIRGGSNPTIIHPNSAAAIALYTGVIGEMNMDTTKTAIVLHDGTTQGGITFQASAVAALSAGATTLESVNKINEIIFKLQTAKLMS